MSVVWFRVDASDEEEVLWKNLDSVKKHIAGLVKAVAENWKRAVASRPRSVWVCASR